MGALGKLLVPVDGFPPSLAALTHAVALAEDSGATIDVLCVEGPDDFKVGSTTPLSPAAREQESREVERAFGEAEGVLGERVSRRNVVGDPLRTIIETASDGEYDLIVMGTHGRVGRLHEMLGSVTEGVVRNASCPVLTVREPGGEYQSFADRRRGRPSLAEHAHHPRS